MTAVAEVRSASGVTFLQILLISLSPEGYRLLRLFFVVECGIACFLCSMRVFKVRASQLSYLRFVTLADIWHVKLCEVVVVVAEPRHEDASPQAAVNHVN